MRVQMQVPIQIQVQIQSRFHVPGGERDSKDQVTMTLKSESTIARKRA